MVVAVFQGQNMLTLPNVACNMQMVSTHGSVSYDSQGIFETGGKGKEIRVWVKSTWFHKGNKRLPPV